MGNMAKMSARDRILTLVDENSFVEIGAMVTKRNTDFNLQEKAVPGDGVITGYGLINGSLVYVYSQDAAALGGSIGEMHAKKIASLYDLAMKVDAPIVGLIDCAGIRLQEATDALAGFGEIYKKQAEASGIIPQIAAILGSCGGGAAVSSVLSDFSVMESQDARIFVNSPNALDGNHIGKCDTGSSRWQAKNGVVDFVCDGEEEAILQVRSLLDMIGSTGESEETEEDLNRLVPSFVAETSDPARALADIADRNEFIEVKKEHAKDMVVGFLQLNGLTIGAVANRTATMDGDGKETEAFAGTLSTDGCLKAERFIRFCDSFHIPILSLTNVKGYAATVEEEKTIAVAAAKLTKAFANAETPKINLIVGNAFGSAYVTMNSKHIGADMVFALPNASIGMMEPDSAVKIMYGEGEASDRDEAVKEYADLQASPEAAAKRGYVDAVIEGESVRKHLIYAFDMLA